MGSEPAPTTNTNTNTPPVTDTGTKPADTKPADTGTKPADTGTTPTPSTGTDPDRQVDAKELPVIDGTWKTYSNSTYKFSFQYPTRGRYAPEWNVSVLRSDDERLDGNCLKQDVEPRSSNGSLTVGDNKFCIVRGVDAGAGQRYYSDVFTVPLGDRIIMVTFTKRLANGDLFEDEACHGKVVISSGTSCILFDEALYRAHLNQIIETYRHE